ncbi:ubiquinol-cytochrome-c reductase complex assembly factor 2 isoform X1 [Myripristis murdjan]|uniref:ubiquinol-cytochrome-c reductase complex assembly factor 2 isoform X1 n=1 Tax=Myripristis murdjan TaxID=586833 RepID=UPI001175E7DC|nr:ubiquinol-cytochrome-c reductase complex assembly factor 2 isoform X1 [Myripristis murdjan]
MKMDALGTHRFPLCRHARLMLIPCRLGHKPCRFLHAISDPEKCDQMYESLARINGNVYRERFPRVRDTSFTGVTVEECRLLLSGSMQQMQQMDEAKKGLWKTLMERFSSKSPDEAPEKTPEK